MGPLVADNFVRFAQGGALAITKHIHTKICPLERRDHQGDSASNITPTAYQCCNA